MILNKFVDFIIYDIILCGRPKCVKSTIQTGGGILETPINQRRLSDISFSIDKNLNVKSGNRSFLVLLRRTDFAEVNLSSILSETDAKNLKFFLETFSKDQGKASETENFIAKIKPGDFIVSCIFTIQKKENEIFDVTVEELSYSRHLLEKALLESREYSALLQNFDAYYFLYDGERFIIKNTKDLNSLFNGNVEDFRKFFSNSFKLNTESLESEAQMKAMLDNIQNFETGKYYNFFRTDKKMLTVHTLKTSTRKKSIIVGSVNFEQQSLPSANLYAQEHDGLTGLYNKKAITELAIKKINEIKEPCSMTIIDVDKFKECNDTYGHIFGDRVLVAVAGCINDAIAGNGIAGRIGGDEFLVILDKTDEADIRNITRNIRAGIQWNITSIDAGSVVTCSMGIARFPLNKQNYESLFKLADKCLYIAKNHGRNCYIIYKPELHDKVIMESKNNENKISNGEFFHDAAETEFQILKCFSNKLCKFQDILSKIVKYMKVSKISVYDANLKPLYIVGTDSENFREDFLKNSNYFSIFNEFGYLHMDNTNILDSVDQKRYKLYNGNNICSTIEVLRKNPKGKITALICFDIYKPAQTFPKEKITFALLVAKLLEQRIKQKII